MTTLRDQLGDRQARLDAMPRRARRSLQWRQEAARVRAQIEEVEAALEALREGPVSPDGPALIPPPPQVFTRGTQTFRPERSTS